jgi:hypothetical protein
MHASLIASADRHRPSSLTHMSKAVVTDFDSLAVVQPKAILGLVRITITAYLNLRGSLWRKRATSPGAAKTRLSYLWCISEV